MTASSVEDIPRGIPFLLNRNRLNVAISRAQYAAVIVRGEALTEYLPAAPTGLVELGAFLALTASGNRA
jgi:superfamily I DNA and/or RNA helicase